MHQGRYVVTPHAINNLAAHFRALSLSLSHSLSRSLTLSLSHSLALSPALSPSLAFSPRCLILKKKKMSIWAKKAQK